MKVIRNFNLFREQSENNFDENEFDENNFEVEDDMRGDLQGDLSFEEEDEEDEPEYIGTRLMRELGEKLDTPVVNNSINYEGEIINFFSETEKFHIGNTKFDTVDDIYDYLMKK